jgi:hypothetical protein
VLTSVEGRSKRRKGSEARRQERLPSKNTPLWVKLEVKGGEVPSLIDTGTQFSCIRRDVLVTVKKFGMIVKTE